jgi:hypothetical protein
LNAIVGYSLRPKLRALRLPSAMLSAPE